MSAGVARGRRLAAALALCAVTLTACANDAGVSTVGAAESDGNPFTPPEIDSSPPSGSTPTDVTDPTDSVAAPVDTVPGRAEELLDFGSNKPDRPYDRFLIAALNDVELFWAEQYPLLYGEPFEPLAGRIYAGYPERTTPIPGCGPEAETSYDELTFFAAFYCPDGDFMAYDDGANGLLAQLAEAFGPSVMGVVLAHEYGHAIQSRSGALDRNLATVTTEQQADCFSGAWVGRVIAGNAPGVTMTDHDIRSGLIALIEVRDPIGIDQFDPGGHGSGFDRVGAFQLGFTDGAAACAPLLDDPLRLMPNEFVGDPGDGDGNAPYGYNAEADQIPGFAIIELNEYWTAVLGGEFTSLTLVPFQSADEIVCEEEVRGDAELGAVLCGATNTVFLDEPLARQRHADLGDFALGYMLGTVWSEAAQIVLASPLEAEERALLNDCLVGAWVRTIIPDAVTGATPRGGEVFIEPGDLDEAIQTAIAVGDAERDDDIVGSAFEKIASFRMGVLDGVPACQAMLTD
jgi:predicted metalloprotease